MYLLPEAILEMRSTLTEALERGVRIVCNTWGLPWLLPTHTLTIGRYHDAVVYVYDSVPAAKSDCESEPTAGAGEEGAVKCPDVLRAVPSAMAT